MSYIHFFGRTSAFWGPDTLWRVPSNALFDDFLAYAFQNLIINPAVAKSVLKSTSPVVTTERYV